MKEMKANELMLGDWVCYRISEHRQSMPMQVCLISEGEAYLTFEGNEADPWIITEDELLPIPLTAEILERNGFRYTNDHTLKGADTYKLDIEYRGYDFKITIKRNDYFAVDSFDDRVYRLVEMQTGVWYVHDLQHALKLCGIEKEIKLERAIYASRVDEAMREVEEKARAFTAAHSGESADEILAQMRGEEWSEEGEL